MSKSLGAVHTHTHTGIINKKVIIWKGIMYCDNLT